MSTATMSPGKTGNVEAIANKLREYCVKGDFTDAQKAMYADDVVSTEPEEMKGFSKETKGKKAVADKMDKWLSSVDKVHRVDVSEPQIAGNAFSFVLQMDLTMKGQERMSMPEICVYTVKDGKVVSEQFFW
ncbi:nuclear transport factor 2 family protein [Flavihumibacter petaseus]|nr:nuclear transport factor 2 family protein [Flavihumibacter petaseus]